MNVLVTDAFSSANRGDAAILDGLLGGLGRRLPEARFTVTSHFPALTRRFHGVDAILDTDAHAVVRAIDEADLVVGCGGSYLHDLYAQNLHPRLATILACKRASKSFVVFGQSIGPLDSPLSRTAARNALDAATWICVRDEASARTVRGLGVRVPLHVGVDAAVAGGLLPQPRPAGPVLGVTARSWHFPGSKDPAAAQERYEVELAAACQSWAGATGGLVRFFANCTALGGYAQDDRVAARRVAARISGRVEVIEAEDLRFDVVRGLAAACDLLVGTRMHSLIFATTAGVPAVGVAYEFKTAEWLDQVGLGGWWRPIEAPEGLGALVRSAWERRAELGARVAERLPELQARAEAQLDQLADIARGARPGPATGAAWGRAGWDEETWRYDRPHRRLRAVADAVLSECAGGRVLDLGCSSGLLGRMLGPRYDYLGLDVAPSVAIDEPGHRVLTADLDADWPVEGPVDVVVASGSLEYVADLVGSLERIRALLRPGGLAVLTLFNLGHLSRTVGSPRHPTWRFSLRLDELLLALKEVGLPPTRVFSSSAGHGPAPAVDAETPTDLDRTGAVQLPLPALLRLAHHLVVVCRAGEPAPGPARVAELAEAGELLDAVRLAVAITRDAPWSARAWSDLGVLFSVAGDANQARQCLERAAKLDPSRPGLREDLAALAV